LASFFASLARSTAGRRPETAGSLCPIAAFGSRKASVWPIPEPHGHVSADTRHTLTPDPRLETALSATKAVFFVLAGRSSPVMPRWRSDA